VNQLIASSVPVVTRNNCAPNHVAGVVVLFTGIVAPVSV
jgi:hypothetical protein